MHIRVARLTQWPVGRRKGGWLVTLRFLLIVILCILSASHRRIRASNGNSPLQEDSPLLSDDRSWCSIVRLDCGHEHVYDCRSFQHSSFASLHRESPATLPQVVCVWCTSLSRCRCWAQQPPYSELCCAVPLISKAGMPGCRTRHCLGTFLEISARYSHIGRSARITLLATLWPRYSYVWTIYRTSDSCILRVTAKNVCHIGRTMSVGE